MFTYLNSVIILYPVINLCQPTPAVMLMNQKKQQDLVHSQTTLSGADEH